MYDDTKTIQLGDTNFESPFRFWLKTEYEKYVLFEVEGKKFRILDFPSILKRDLDHEVFVKTSNMIKNETVYFFSPEYLREYEKITASLYHVSKENPNIFVYSGEEVSRTYPNKKTIERAIQYFNNVVEKELARKRFENEFNSNTKDGISSFLISFSKEDLNKLKDLYTIVYDYSKDNYKFTGIVIDKTKILPQKSSISIKVINYLFDEVTGYNKKNINRVAKELGLRHIKVKKIIYST